MRKANLVLSVFVFIRAYCRQCTEAKYKEMCGIVFHYKFMNTGTLSVSGIMCLKLLNIVVSICLCILCEVLHILILS